MKKDNQYYLFAKEDIYDENHEDLLYLKDELIGNISILKKTKEIDVLPRGTYYLKNKDISQSTQEVWIEEKLASWKYFENVLLLQQKITIDLKVIDVMSQKILSGTHCGLFAGADIFDHHGQFIYSKDDFIIDLQCQENKVCKVPLLNVDRGTFYIQQLDVIEGYLGNTEHFSLEVDFKAGLVDFAVVIENQPTVIEISKLDEKGDYLKGAWLAVYDENERLVDEWISEKEHILYGLGIDHRYVIKELEAPDGYDPLPEFSFRIKNTKNVQKIKLINYQRIKKTGEDKRW